MGQVTLSSSESRVTIPVTVTVVASVFGQLNPLFFAKTYQGGNPLSQVITLASTGSAIRYSAIAVDGTGGNWLSVSPDGCCAYTPQTTTVTVNPDVTLAPGTYTTRIIFRSVDGTQANVSPSPSNIGVTSQPATAKPVFSLAPGSYTAAQTLTLSDATPGAVIYYTSNGTAPTTSSTKYVSAITCCRTRQSELQQSPRDTP